MEPILTTANLAKSYGTTRALQGCSLCVPADAVYALIGAGGAGKSTLLKILGGQEKPLTGTCRFRGIPVRLPRTMKGDIRFIPADPAFRSRKTCREILLAAGGPSRERIPGILETAGLSRVADMQVRYLPFDCQQRLAIARTLPDDPNLLLLDEPFRDLDTGSRRRLDAFIRTLHESYGITFLISAASAGQLHGLATHYGFLNGGRLAGEFSASEIEASVLLRVSSARRAAEVLEGHLPTLIESEQMLRVFGGEDLSGILLALRQAGIDILHSREETPRMHVTAVSGKGAKQWAAC